MKQIIPLILLALLSLGARAQSPISFQVKAGAGTSDFYGEDTKSNTRIAYKAGIGMNYEISRTWVLQPSLDFVSIGAREEIEGLGKANVNELYIQLPVMMSARLHFGKDYSASLSAGPYIACGVGGKSSGEAQEEYTHDSSIRPDARRYRFRTDTFGNRADNKMGNRRLDAGLMLGLHFEYHRFIFGTEVQLGLLKVNNQWDWAMPLYNIRKFAPKNLASFFTAGYRF